MTVPPIGIFARGTDAHAFLEWDLRPGIDLRQASSVIGRLRGPSVSACGVIGIGDDGISDDGIVDRLTDFSRPVSGACYYAPPLNLLADLPTTAESRP